MGSLIQDVIGLFSKKKYAPVPYDINTDGKEDFLILSKKLDSSLNVMAYNPKLEQELISIKNLSNALGKAEGTVISVSGAGTVSGLTLTGTVTTSGDLTLGGTLSLTSANVTDALTFTPYNATNPSSFTSNLGIVQSVTSNVGTLQINANGVLNVPPTAGAPVDSVNGAVGVVDLNTGDIPENTNLYYTEARVSANTDVAANTLKISFDNTSSTRLANTSGNNTGDQDLSGYLLNTTDTLTGDLTVSNSVAAPTFLGDLNGTINTLTTAITKPNATSDTTVATTAFVKNLIGEIPAGLSFEGTWNADTNMPDLSTATLSNGKFWIVSISGATDLGGITDWKVGDWAIYVTDGAGTDGWQKVDNSSVLDGQGTGQTVALWSGSGDSNTLTNSPITVSGDDVTFAGLVTMIDRLDLSDSLSNSFIGSNSGISNTTGTYNVGLGTNALYSNTTGGSNVGIGLNALYSNTTGTFNIALGQSALYANIEGNGNIALGVSGLGSNTSGSQNISLGNNSLENNTIGNYNLGLGYQVLKTNTTGGYNIALGSQGLSNNTTGSSNIALGHVSLFENTTGTSNIALGISSLQDNTTGSQNVALGNSSLNDNTSGLYNVSLGFASMRSNITGSHNIGLGNRSGQYIADGSGNTSGLSSIFIGSNTRANADGQTNQIVIGDTAIGNGNNTVTLGNDSIVATYLKGAITVPSYGAGTLVTDASGNITVSSGGGAGGPYVTLATAQTISGAKTFSDTTTTLVKIVGNETSDNTAQLIIASGGVDKNSIIHFTDDDGSLVNAIGSVEGQILTFAAQNDLEFKVGTSSIVGNAENNRMTIRSEGVNVINTLSAIGNFSTALTGTVSVFATNNTVGGTGTLFITELKVGDAIKIGTQKFTVASIIDDLNLTIDSLFVAPDVTNVTAYTDANLFSIKNGDNQEKVTISKTGHLNIGSTSREAPNYAYSLNLVDNNAAISFGDNSLSTQNVLVGEFGVGDTDKLWLHGKLGTIFSYDGDLNESIQRAMTIGETGYVAVNDTLQNSTLLERFSVRGNTYMKSSTGVDGNLNIKATQKNQLTYGYANVGAGDLVIGGHGTTTQQPAVISLINQNNPIGANEDLGVIQFAGKDDNTDNAYCSTQIIASTYQAMGSGSPGGGVLRFLTGGTTGGSYPTEAMRIDAIRNVGINTGSDAPTSRLQVNGGIQMADDTATASSAKVGTLRYRTATTGPASYASYVDMCMQTGVGAYQWVNIITQSW